MQAARRAVAAGFDGIELHGARGYLLDDFLSATSNRRTDNYGGSLQGRLALPLRVIREVRAAIGDVLLSYNLSIYKMDDNTYQPPGGKEEAGEIARALAGAGADILHVTTRKLLRPAMALPLSCKRFIAGVPIKRAANVVAGRAYISRGAAHCSTLPWCSSTTWSAMLMASAWSWVT